MRLQFTTSVSEGYIEGQVIDVPRPAPQHLEWLRRGVLRALPDIETETVLTPEAVEKAIARRSGRGRRRPSRPVKGKAPDDSEGPPVAPPVLCPGGTVVCLGCGPSLTAADVDYCRGKATVIAVNDAHRLAPWADVLYSSDQRWWEHYRGVPEFKGLRFGVAPLRPAAGWGVVVLKNTGDAGIEPLATGLRTGRNSGAAAINLAVHLGAKRVVLLGYDMGRTNGKAHWFGEHPEKLRAASPFGTFIAMFERMVGPLEQLGVEVVNCSRTTALECFPRALLEQTL